MWDRYLLIPWADGGRDFSGCDCWGLVRLVYANEYGTELPDYRIGCKEVSRIHTQITAERWRWTKLNKAEAPCIVLMQDFDNPENLCHFGVYVGNQEMIHMRRRQGVARTPIDHPAIVPLIEGFYGPPI